MGASDLPKHVQTNRHYWDGMADQWVAAGERLWASEPQWGQWGVSNAEAPLLHGNTESLPFTDERFDFAISEYGAAIWADPYLWIPEAHRLLRLGGRLVFLNNSPLQMLCIPEDSSETTARLERSYFDMYRFNWRAVKVDPDGIEFNLPISAWIRLFLETGFAIEDYLELVAPRDAQGSPFGVSAEWARSYPSEQVWMLRKQAHDAA